MVGKFVVVLLLMPFLSIFLPIKTLADYQMASDQVASDQKPLQCARAIPKPIIKKSVFPNTKFVLQNIDYASAIVPMGLETVLFPNGDKLIIVNSGCEYFTLNFQFETSRFTGDTTNPKYWFDRSVELMRQTEQGLETSIDIKQGIKALENYSANSPKPSFDQEIDYGGQVIRSFVKLTEAKKLNEEKFVIAVTFAVGPL
jgi:hypothetical protein